MVTFTITKNANADIGYFDIWMRESYPGYDGYSLVPDQSYISVHSDPAFTAAEKTTITDYYTALTVDKTVDLKHCRIYDFIDVQDMGNDMTQAPTHIDYVRSLSDRLHMLVTNIYKGEVREITYYESITQNQDGTLTGVNPVVRENYTYTRDVAKMAVSRVMTINWINKDGTDNYISKTRTKYYAPEERIVEGQRLRGNIIDYMQPPVLYMIMQTEQVSYDDAVTIGAELFRTYAANISSWIGASRGNDLMQLVIDDTTIAWLDNVIDGNSTTIRDYILDQLNY